MQILLFFGAISLLIASVLADASAEIFYWPVAAPKPSLLARVSYDPVSLKSDLVSYHPPTDLDSDGLVRLGLYASTSTGSKQWTGTLVSSSSLTSEDHQPTLRLHLGPDHKIYHVSLAALTSAETVSSGPQLELVPNGVGTQPHLNRPVVVGPDGQNTEEVQEKTLLQK